MEKKNQIKNRISFAASNDLLIRLKETAIKQEASTSHLIRIALNQYLVERNESR